MSEKEPDWILNMRIDDPEDPEGFEGKTYGVANIPGRGPTELKIGDEVPGGTVEGFVPRGIRILPEKGPEYIRYLGDREKKSEKKLTPRAEMKDAAAAMALERDRKIEEDPIDLANVNIYKRDMLNAGVPDEHQAEEAARRAQEDFRASMEHAEVAWVDHDMSDYPGYKLHTIQDEDGTQRKFLVGDEEGDVINATHLLADW